MSLAAKNSRAIDVDGKAYRWAVSPDSGYNVLVVQAADGSGAKLLTTVDYSGTHYASADENGSLAITPALVVSIIRQAREYGWQPNQTGNDFACRLMPDESIELRTSGGST